jgi:uncharacterized membrane protein HdeD (DUF308 family)
MHIVGITGLGMGILAVIFGIIVFIFPRILNYLVGAFLLIVGGIAIWQALA